MSDTIIYRLLDINSFNLRLNEDLPKFILISELLAHHSIPFETWETDLHSPEIFEMGFGSNCNFQDVYLIAYLLKDFGLKRIYPLREEEIEIQIGTYLYRLTDKNRCALAESIGITEFLQIDPKLSTQNVIESKFPNQLEYDEEDEFDDEYSTSYQNQYFDDGDVEDYKRDTFDALTDGQYGDYDEWRENGGDLDSLRDALGH